MYNFLVVLLLTGSTPYFADDHYCKEIIEILRENVRDGYINVMEARRIAKRCSNDLFKD